MSWLGVAAALGLFALTPAYLKRALGGDVTPHPVSWGIWATLGVLGTATTASAHGGPVVIVLSATACVQVAVFAVALRGTRDTVALAELWPLLPAALGMVVWLAVHSPLAGSIGVVVADICGLVPTVVKTWAEPHSEPPWLWAAGALVFLLGSCSVSQRGVATLLYPTYLVVGNLLIAAVSWVGRRRVGLVAARPRVGV